MSHLIQMPNLILGLDNIESYLLIDPHRTLTGLGTTNPLFKILCCFQHPCRQIWTLCSLMEEQRLGVSLASNTNPLITLHFYRINLPLPQGLYFICGTSAYTCLPSRQKGTGSLGYIIPNVTWINDPPQYPIK